MSACFLFFLDSAPQLLAPLTSHSRIASTRVAVEPCPPRLCLGQVPPVTLITPAILLVRLYDERAPLCTARLSSTSLRPALIARSPRPCRVPWAPPSQSPSYLVQLKIKKLRSQIHHGDSRKQGAPSPDAYSAGRFPVGATAADQFESLQLPLRQRSQEQRHQQD